MLSLTLALLTAAGGVTGDDAAPTLEVTATPPSPLPGGVAVTSVPQLGLVGVEGQLQVHPRVRLELTGWNAFAGDGQTFVRGGFVGGELVVLRTDALEMVAGVRGFAAQARERGEVLGGLAGRVGTRIKVSSLVELRPDFDLTWLGPLVSARFASELAFTLGAWRLAGQAGAQVWARDGEVSAAPAVALAVAWRHTFTGAALELGGALGVSRDPAFLLHHPVLSTPRPALGFDAAVRVGVTF